MGCYLCGLNFFLCECTLQDYDEAEKARMEDNVTTGILDDLDAFEESMCDGAYFRQMEF